MVMCVAGVVQTIAGVGRVYWMHTVNRVVVVDAVVAVVDVAVVVVVGVVVVDVVVVAAIVVVVVIVTIPYFPHRCLEISCKYVDSGSFHMLIILKQCKISIPQVAL